jgi:glycosidase
LKNLGVDAIWITPFCQSPSYHKYDVVDYKKIDPEYGTMDDFKHLIAEAHKRKILIIKDFVINHTSDQHPWFLEAKKGKNNPYRAYYNWMTPQKIDSMGVATREASGGSWELKPWHFVNKNDDEKYYGLFWSGMPDLNFDNPKVRREIYDIGKFWLKDIGVDGFRLDAAKHLYPEWEAQKCHAFWQEFKQEMTTAKPNVYLVGEVWADAKIVAPFFKGLNANFDIDACLKLWEIIKTGKEQDFIKTLLANYQTFSQANPDFINATIIDNHDQNRIGNTLEGNIGKMKVAANLLLTLPGEPYIYYGEEIGMFGQKPDENIREPFLWDVKSADKYRTSWIKPTFTTESTVKPLSIQKTDINSIYNHYKKLISFRKSQVAMRQVSPANLKESSIKQEGIIAFIRPHSSGDLLVIHNISSEDKNITLDTKSQFFKKIIFKTSAASLNKNIIQIPAFSVVVLK